MTYTIQHYPAARYDNADEMWVLGEPGAVLGTIEAEYPGQVRTEWLRKLATMSVNGAPCVHRCYGGGNEVVVGSMTAHGLIAAQVSK